jgi:hypothetical protein
MARAYTEEEFKAKCAALYGDKFTLKSFEKIYQGSDRPRILMSCEVHGEVATRLTSVTTGLGCPRCGEDRKGQAAKDTLESFVAKAVKIHGAEGYNYLRIDNDKIVYLCPLHGEVTQNKNSHLNGHRCYDCGRGRKVHNKDTLESFTQKARKVHGDLYTYTKLEPSSIEYVCKIHGKVSQNRSNHLQGSACPNCAKYRVQKIAKTFDEVVAAARLAHGDRYFYKELNQGYLLYTCSIHGDVLQRHYDHTSGHGCEQCGWDVTGEIKSRDKEAYLLEVAKRENLAGLPLEYLEVDRKHVLFSCPEHGEQIQTKDSHLKYSGCPVCSRKTVSGFSTAVAEWLDSEKISYLAESKLPYAGTRKVADFVVGDLVLELNGVYWHTEDRVGTEGHKEKLDLATANGYRFIMFSDLEWNNKSDIIKRSILRRVGASRESSIGARSLSLKSSTAAEARLLLDKHHIQGYANASHWFGLYEGTQLVAVAGFTMKTTGRGRSAHSTEAELIRYCTSKNVVGGCSKLIAKAHKELNFTTLNTFSDNRFFEGGVYRACGFVEARKIAPSYNYSKQGKIINKASLQKTAFACNPKMLYDPTLTERELAELNGFKRIYDAGKTLWIKTYQ